MLGSNVKNILFLCSLIAYSSIFSKLYYSAISSNTQEQMTCFTLHKEDALLILMKSKAVSSDFNLPNNKNASEIEQKSEKKCGIYFLSAIGVALTFNFAINCKRFIKLGTI